MRGGQPTWRLRFVAALSLLCALLLAACAWARVTTVVDGDTVDVVVTSEDFPDDILVEGQGYRVRLIGIDTPEVYGQVGCYGPEASAFVRGLLEGKQVVLERDVSNTDRYGRLLRWVWAELDPSRAGPELVNEETIRAGYATVATYPPDVKYVDLLLAAERYARENNRGLWGACPVTGPPTPPPTTGGSCDPSYPTVCIPPPDLDCGDIPHRGFQVLPPDPHRFDGDHDGVGCES